MLHVNQIAVESGEREKRKWEMHEVAIQFVVFAVTSTKHRADRMPHILTYILAEQIIVISIAYRNVNLFLCVNIFITSSFLLCCGGRGCEL